MNRLFDEQIKRFDESFKVEVVPEGPDAGYEYFTSNPHVEQLRSFLISCQSEWVENTVKELAKAEKSLKGLAESGESACGFNEGLLHAINVLWKLREPSVTAHEYAHKDDPQE